MNRSQMVRPGVNWSAVSAFGIVMLFWLIVAVVLLSLSGQARAGEQSTACEDVSGQPQTTSPQHPCAGGQGLLTSVTGSQYGLTLVTATTLTIPTYGTTHVPASIAVITVEGAPVRWTCDGVTTPTATVGMVMAAGTQQAVFVVNPLSACKFIQSGGTATIDVEYYHQ